MGNICAMQDDSSPNPKEFIPLKTKKGISDNKAVMKYAKNAKLLII